MAGTWAWSRPRPPVAAGVSSQSSLRSCGVGVTERRQEEMEKAIALALLASVCTATASVCQRLGARDSQPSGLDVWLVLPARAPSNLAGRHREHDSRLRVPGDGTCTLAHLRWSSRSWPWSCCSCSATWHSWVPGPSGGATGWRRLPCRPGSPCSCSRRHRQRRPAACPGIAMGAGRVPHAGSCARRARCCSRAAPPVADARTAARGDPRSTDSGVLGLRRGRDQGVQLSPQRPRISLLQLVGLCPARRRRREPAAGVPRTGSRAASGLATWLHDSRSAGREPAWLVLVRRAFPGCYGGPSHRGGGAGAPGQRRISAQPQQLDGRACLPASTFSKTVISPNTRRFWNVRPMPKATRASGRSKVMSRSR